MIPETQEREAFFEAVFEAAAVGLALVDPAGRFIRSNAAFRGMVGYDEAALRGRALRELMHPDDVGRGEVPFTPLLENSRSSCEFSKRYLRQDGRVVSLHLTASRVPNGLLVSIVRDVTAELRAREQLHRTQEQLGIALASVQMGFWEWDVSNDRMMWSEEMARLCALEITPTGHRFGTHFDLIHPDDVLLVSTTMRDALQDRARASVECEFRLIRPDAEERWFLGKGHIFRDDRGNPLRVLGALIDVTHRHLLQQQLLQAQKMEAVGTFASGVAHDFNNALTVIMGHCDVMEMVDATSETLQEGLIEISNAAERAAHLTRQLLTFSRKEASNPRILNPNDTLLSLEGFLRPLTGLHQLRLHLSPLVSTIRIDERQLEQAIVNLVVNARDAMVDTGVITITTAMAADGRVTVAVTDTGKGIDEKVRARLFEPFFTTKAPGKGTGLGLAVVLAVVDQARGDVHVESAPGRGSTFELRFPAAA